MITNHLRGILRRRTRQLTYRQRLSRAIGPTIRAWLDAPFQVPGEGLRDEVRAAAEAAYPQDADYSVNVLDGLVEEIEEGFWVDAVVWVPKDSLANTCQHNTHEDHFICRECGRCQESLDQDDICGDCRASENDEGPRD